MPERGGTAERSWSDRLLHEPRLRTVLLAVHLLILALPLAGIFLLRLYDSQLVRRTEAELIVQGAAISASYRAELRRAAGEQGVELTAWGRPSTVPTPKHDDPFDPAIPGLDLVRHPLLPPAPEARKPGRPADPVAKAAGRALEPQLAEIQRTSLAGLRIVDPSGVVVASSGAELGLDLSARPEVAAALDGHKSSVIRRKESDDPPPPLADIRRGTRLRVVVAFPIQGSPISERPIQKTPTEQPGEATIPNERSGGSNEDGRGATFEPAAVDPPDRGKSNRIWGAVVLARTPLSVRQALWRERGHLLAGGLVVLGVMGLVTLLTAWTLGRPLEALIRQTERVRRGERGAARPLERPGTREVARISRAVAEMARSLEERAEYIATFAANVSHEFKTPLTSIAGTVELLRDHADEMEPAERERFLSMLEKDAGRLERLVDRLLELARADVLRPGDETAEVSWVVSDLAARFDGVSVVPESGEGPGRADGPTAAGSKAARSARSRLARPRSALRPSGLVRQSSRSAPGSSGSRERWVAMASETLESVLSNLVENAVRHGGDVEIGVARVGDSVVVEVSDDGPGISAANLPRIFDRFFTTRRDEGGSGLGLAIVRSLVEAHGGRVEVRSRPGETVISVTLPSAPAMDSSRRGGARA